MCRSGAKKKKKAPDQPIGKGKPGKDAPTLPTPSPTLSSGDEDSTPSGDSPSGDSIDKPSSRLDRSPIRRKPVTRPPLPDFPPIPPTAVTGCGNTPPPETPTETPPVTVAISDETPLTPSSDQPTPTPKVVRKESKPPVVEKAKLKIRVVKKGDSSVVFGAARVTSNKAGSAQSAMDTGVADFGSVAVGEHTITATLQGEAAKNFVSPEKPLVVKLSDGDDVTRDYEVIEVVHQVIELVKDAVAVKKKNATVARRTVVLKTDKAFSGKGTFTCASDCVRFYYNGELLPFDGKTEKTFDSVGGGITLDVEGVKHSTLKGVTLGWKLLPGAEPIGGAVSNQMTAVDATLELQKKSGASLSEEEKNGDGRTVHKQNKDKTLSRAKLTVKCLPADWPGTLILDAVKSNVVLFDADKAGSEVPVRKEIAVGPGSTAPVFWVEGKAESSTKTDSGYKLFIKNLAETDPVDLAKMTVVKSELQVREYKTSAADGAKVGDDAKKDPGVKVYKFSRRMLVIAQAGPQGLPLRAGSQVSWEQRQAVRC